MVIFYVFYFSPLPTFVLNEVVVNIGTQQELSCYMENLSVENFILALFAVHKRV